MRARRSCRLLVGSRTTSSAGRAGDLELGVAVGPDSGSAAGQDVSGCHVADRAVQADDVVVLDPASDERASLVESRGLAKSDRLDAETARRWLRAAPAAETALVPVEVVMSSEDRRTVSIVSPAGYRVDGLSVEDAAALLRRLG